MAGSISSLGIGSGVLTSDVIDQLKEADKAKMVTPVEKKVTANQQKQDSFSLLTSLMTSFKASASALSYDTIFDNKNVSVTGDAQVSVEAGSNVSSFTLETVTLAKKDITQLGAVASSSSSVASADGTLTINGTAVSYTSGMTLDELAQAITDTVGSSVDASVLQTGTGQYSLVLTSASTGADQAITVTDTSGFLDAALFDPYDAATNPTGYQKIQTATDATFKYNGITATRSTNDISDLITGVSISLKTEGDISTVDISQDTSSVTDEMQNFVDAYNTLMTNLKDMTVYDAENGVKGVFSGDSFVKSLGREITNTITTVNGSGNSLLNYGIDIDRYGTMSFDSSVLDAALSSDSDAVKEFFTGGTDSNGDATTGVFENITDRINDYTSYGGLLSTYETSLKSEGTALSETLTRAQEMLDNRYAIMTKRFAAYDSMINKTNSMFSSLQMMIDAQANG